MTVTISKDPIVVFRSWLAQAEKSEPRDPTAMTLATATPDGRPSARMVLLKDVDERGFTFYTNLGSRKARELEANRQAALCFHWKSSNRQVRVEGTVESVDAAEADAYFASRPRMSRIGAWASKQSQSLEGMFELEARVVKFTARFNVGEVPRPSFWSGYRVRPARIEFWEEKQFRLHERVVFELADGAWTS
ncbi:MAG TPA: pyridoxamine 5'-phosphate oxidase, partial [Alphaproteobacteria bacterium]|nr:pyridoxamine 5'-phosphate oxidase [Alphaproteobacteria bacterium]